jgi:CBS-domain-containing membrane protein
MNFFAVDNGRLYTYSPQHNRAALSAALGSIFFGVCTGYALFHKYGVAFMASSTLLLMCGAVAYNFSHNSARSWFTMGNLIAIVIGIMGAKMIQSK